MLTHHGNIDKVNDEEWQEIYESNKMYILFCATNSMHVEAIALIQRKIM